MKLQTLKQGDKSVEAYYQELLIFCHVVAYMRMIRLFLLDFLGGWNHDTKDILD
jgi:hypothetical protein